MYLKTASVFLSLSFLAIHAFKDRCTEKLEGDSHTITLNSARQRGDKLIWKCNDTVIYQRTNDTVQTSVNVDEKGSLSLTKLNSSMSCTYKAEHHDSHRKLIKATTETLCVLPRAPVPELAVKCSSAGVATLHCEQESIARFTLTWVLNNKDLQEKRNPFQPNQRGEKDRYRCRLSNSLGKQDSKEVTISCGAPGSDTVGNKLICIKKQVMLVVLAGLGFLLLVLTLSLVIVSCKNCGQRKRKHDNEELRLCYLKDTSTDPQQLKQAIGDKDHCNIQTQEMVPVPAACQPSSEPQPAPVENAPGTPGTSGTPGTPGTPGTSGTPVPQPRRKLNLIPKS
ncbi:hepatic and glial cell adhesion molecule-like isoform X2 [Sardina pilchardus]|uniref:hepatic and glial cell adhesion molecule-like isoform X2 n=1 Tax=Sardina pilchardus TaxID=27697 RepID=UPI002E119D0E